MARSGAVHVQLVQISFIIEPRKDEETKMKNK
jgi:hypothetical protein